ncbi:SAM-dependent chlorinase/fluorinase [Infirmifilum lucidum]|uniref:SAM-dependent chlorinase/fluorinase n=1 Tax=Infirmifilum lucidum TaxID=2776706 RepID=A0A7L9FI24_9CREN|nr:SAM-dependent chlorinase/fluorinase [Infirmifilum lucidum]QOJ78405.1 SAM-dependent chlorinase/fluorinase [Infirmifilum lucidum]
MGELASPVNLVAFMSDFGSKDYYTGAVKAVIKRVCPRAEVIDITHEVDPWSTLEADYLLSCCFDDFPPGAIFLAVVDPGVGTGRRPIIVRTSRYWLVGPDNGVFSSVIEKDGLVKAWTISRVPYQLKSSYTFHGRDIFAPVAAYLACGGNVEDIGLPLDKLVRLDKPETTLKDGRLLGYVAHIDRFGNVATSIDTALLSKAGISYGSELEVLVGESSFRVKFVKTFGDAGEGELVALVNSCKVLEFAVNKGRASEYIAAKIGHRVEIVLPGMHSRF